MSLQILLSSTGECLRADIDSISTPESLKRWIERNSNVPFERQILMTVKGKNVKQQHLLSDAKIFVYDKAFLTSESDESSPYSANAHVFEIQDFPSNLEDEESLKAWQDLFASRRAWALEVADMVRKGVSTADKIIENCEVLEECSQVALENLLNHFLSLQQTAERTQTWASDVLVEHNEVLKEWHNSLKILSELPIREEVAHLFRSQRTSLQQDTAGTMLGMVDVSDLEIAAGQLSIASGAFQDNSHKLTATVKELNKEIEQVMNLGKMEWPGLSTEGMVKEVEAMATKVSRDYEEVLKTTQVPKSLSPISRLAARHTQELLPALAEIATDVLQLLENGKNHREHLRQNMRHALKQISKIQLQFAGTHVKISSLMISEEGQASFETLDRVFHLPLTYGSILVEAIRRSEWDEKMRGDMDSLREEIALHTDEEIRRRKKWAESLRGFLDEDALATEPLIDVNLSVRSKKWPLISRQEMSSYIEDLRALGINDAVEQLEKLKKELGSSGKARRAKTTPFKNGSVLDLGQSFLRAGDEVKGLQDDKIRLEEKLRASESRIRKLEDLLHRQSQTHRPPAGIFGPSTDFERQVSTPGPSFGRPAEMQSRRSSVSLRRLSNQNLDDKAMVHRIVTLEAQISKLQEETLAERRSSTESRDKMQEAESVKRDLMANFEAQRQEFDDERQLLDDENHKLKIRLEEAEDELDRILGSRDHQRMTQDQTITSLRTDIERLRKNTEEEIDQLRRSKERSQTDFNGQLQRISSLEHQVQQYKEENSALQAQKVDVAGQIRAFEVKEQGHIVALQGAHAHLSPSSIPPDNLERLTRALEVLAEGSAIHSRQLDDTLQRMTAEKKANDAKILSLESQLRQHGEKLQQVQREKRDCDEQLSEKHNKIAAIRAELVDEQAELRKLRDKFAAGETGSDALKIRVAEQEERVAKLMEMDGEKDAHIQILRQELDKFEQQTKDSDHIKEGLRLHLHARGEKAKDLSERLFQHSDRLVRMVESFGYLITQQNNTLILQRASKVSASLTFNPDGGSPMKRVTSGTAPVEHFTEPTDLDSLYWTADDSQQDESTKFEAFIKSISRLDLDSTMEIITKRYKDVEGLAKKYQKDSRAHRDRCHRLQGEAHDKIAYRSFKEGDLALFLPTRNQATRPWAAFNVGAPHYFLRELDAHKLQTRDWLLARILRIEERVVDLSRSLTGTRDRISINAEGSDGGSLRSVEDENPFELSDGLRWYMIDAAEEKPGAPTTPGLGKSTAAASVVEVKGHMSRKLLSGRELGDGSAVNVAKSLHKSLDSRRSSETSRKSGNAATLRAQGSGNSGIQGAASAAIATRDPIAGSSVEETAESRMLTPSVRPSVEDTERDAQGQVREDARVFEVGARAVAATEQPYSSAHRSSSTKARLDHTVKRTQEEDVAAAAAASPTKRSWNRIFNLEYKG